jgi:hypothetical protein
MIDFDGTKNIINDVFEPYYDANNRVYTKSYIYVISKIVDGRRFL